jgi:hypothetical protein
LTQSGKIQKFNGMYMFPVHAFAWGDGVPASWQKYYPEFFVAIFNQQPMGLQLETLKEDAKHHGITVRTGH